MVKDAFAVIMLGVGFYFIFFAIIMELMQVPGWIDSQYHDLGLVASLGTGIAAMFYSHSRMDHVETSEALNEIFEVLDKIQEDIHEIKNDIKKLSEDNENKGT